MVCVDRTLTDAREAEVQVARERWDDFNERTDAERRKPPRAAGNAAP
jgi:hypothetical protein